MINKGLVLSALTLTAALTSIYFFGSKSTQPLSVSTLAEANQLQLEEEPKMVKPYDKRTRMDLAMEQYVEMTRDPQEGYVPNERLWKAYKNAEKQRVSVYQKMQSKTTASIAGFTWSERGPNNVGGRTRAILVDANDGTGNTIFAASVSGGLWKTTDITQATPNWVSVDDFFDNMAITSIAQNPNDPDSILFGTGEGYFNSDAVKGNGIWLSVDGGTNWTQLPSTITTDPSSCAGAGNCNFDYVQGIVVTGTGAIVAATRGRFSNRGGIMRSKDGGVTWTKVSTGDAGATRDWAADIVLAANGDLYASFGIGHTDGIYKSTDDGVTWTRVYASAVNEQRIELATAPSNNQVVYAIVEGASNQVSQMIKTTNGGTGWSTLGTTTWNDQCTPSGADFSRGQAFYDLAIAVDPNNENNVFIGGIDLFKSTNGGTSWTQISEWANCNPQPNVHADQHAIVFAPGSSSIVYFGNDGGVYRSADANLAQPSFQNKGMGYNTTQFYACAMHPDALSNHFLAGAQDNGSQRFSTTGINSTVEVTGGDGAFCHIDQDEPQYQFTQYIYNRFRRSTDGGTSFLSVNATDDGKFINPSDYDDVNNIMYSSTQAGFYKRWNDPQTGSSFTDVDISGTIGGDEVSALRVSPNTSNRVFMGTDGGMVIRVDNANGAASVTDITGAGFPSGYVTCVEVETGDDNHLIVTFSNYGVASVWESTDGGTSWTDVEGDLPDMPIRWALFNPDNADQVVLATEVGVWSTDNLNGGSTDWDPSVSGLANVRVDMLQYRPSDKLLIAATHGRGLFSSDVFSNAIAAFSSDKQLEYIGKDITFTDASLGATSWSWDFGDGQTSTAQNPVHAYATSGLFTVALTINSGASTETKVDYIHILPNEGTPYAPTDGGNFETELLDFGAEALSGGLNVWERGVPTNFLNQTVSASNVWKTDLDADLPDATYSSALYTPNYNMTAAGAYTLQLEIAMESQFCNAPYTLQVHYSLDKGVNWTRLGDKNDGNGFNWYFRTGNDGPTCSVSGIIVADSTGWSGLEQAAHFTAQYDISAFAGNQNVAFRMVVYSSSAYAGTSYQDGYSIDNFQIFGPPNSPVPVDMGGLTATFTNTEEVTLDWLTYSETNNSHFEVYRSVDGNDFTFIGEVPGKGNSSSLQGYTFVDGSATENLYYYRLKQVDLDGVANFSKIVTASKKRKFAINNLYPVPFTSALTIQFDNPPITPVTIVLVDEMGKVHYRFEGYIGSRHTLKPASTTRSGVYILQIQSNTGTLQRKVLKQ